VRRERLTQIVLVIVGLLNLAIIYPLFMDLWHSSWLKVPLCMSFLARALEQSDSAGRDLVLDCIEALSACQWEEQIRQWAGPQVSAAWGYTR